MADIEVALRTRITDTTTALGARVYPSLVADSSTVTPYATYSRTDGNHVKVMSGPGGVAEAEFDLLLVTSGTSAYKDVKAIRDTLRLNMDGRSGSWGGVKVRYCAIENENDEPNFAIDANQQRREAIGLRMRFWYFESTTT